MATTQDKASGSKKSTQRASGTSAKEVSPKEDILNASPLTQQSSKPASANELESNNEPNSRFLRGEAITDEQRREHISVAAYYNAEKRGFSGDGQLEDWLEAEKQVGNYYTGGTANNREQQPIQQIIDQPEARLDDADARSDPAEVIDPSDIKRWAKDLGISAPTLREAINRVGAKVEDVKRFLSDEGTKH
jgi:hypothetical protein